MQLPRDLKELIEAGVISDETAGKIAAYYQTKAGPPQHKLLIIFGILGALLVGMGIILILAHNWDELSRGIKTVIAFIPLVAGQSLCGYTLLRKKTSTVWREASSSFLVMSIGICISLIGQIYHVPGSLESFLFSWILLTLPVIYVMNSSMASLLYIIGITAYACETGYWMSPAKESYLYWGMLSLALPHYYYLYRKRAGSNFFTFHNWFIPLSVITALGTAAKDIPELMYVAYVSLFGLLYMVGYTPVLRDEKVRNNGYLVLGSTGTVAILLALSFHWIWNDLRAHDFSSIQWLASPELITSVVCSAAALSLMIYQKKNLSPFRVRPVEFVFILFAGVFIIGLYSPVSTLLVNVMLLGISILTIREGAQKNHFGILNYGLLIITALVICRFFDTRLSFVLRGLLFIGVGVGFFVANYKMIDQRRKADAATPPEI